MTLINNSPQTLTNGFLRFVYTIYIYTTVDFHLISDWISIVFLHFWTIPSFFVPSNSSNAISKSACLSATWRHARLTSCTYEFRNGRTRCWTCLLGGFIKDPKHRQGVGKRQAGRGALERCFRDYPIDCWWWKKHDRWSWHGLETFNIYSSGLQEICFFD